jgi:luciferase-type oxidoreductase
MDHAIFDRMFRPGELTLGMFFAIEAYPGAIPTMANQIELARRTEEVGFDALWVRDVPLHVPEFGDVGQIYDPWVWLGVVAAETSRIALGTASIALNLRHPIHVAKAAASVDAISNGRLILGLASGDRPLEYPAFGRDLELRAEHFRESLAVLRQVTEESFPAVQSSFGSMEGADLLPKPTFGRLPVLVTGRSGQTLEWIAEHAEGWLTYPRPPADQAKAVEQWRTALRDHAGDAFKPFSQSLYIDLLEDPAAPPTPIHLGWRLGTTVLVELLGALRDMGVNHVIFNLKYGSRPAADVLEQLASEVLPQFRSTESSTSAV